MPMRMGQNAADSVLDSSGEARWVKRLFVADNSALANGLGGPNPTLTTQALATRTAEKIFERYFGGDRWIGKEEPVSSIEPAITQAIAEGSLEMHHDSVPSGMGLQVFGGARLMTNKERRF